MVEEYFLKQTHNRWKWDDKGKQNTMSNYNGNRITVSLDYHNGFLHITNNERKAYVDHGQIGFVVSCIVAVSLNKF